jgi:hypothetical protein
MNSINEKYIQPLSFPILAVSYISLFIIIYLENRNYFYFGLIISLIFLLIFHSLIGLVSHIYLKVLNKHQNLLETIKVILFSNLVTHVLVLIFSTISTIMINLDLITLELEYRLSLWRQIIEVSLIIYSFFIPYLSYITSKKPELRTTFKTLIFIFFTIHIIGIIVLFWYLAN